MFLFLNIYNGRNPKIILKRFLNYNYLIKRNAVLNNNGKL